MSGRLRAKLTSKGQITLPIEIRRHFDLKPGDQIAFDPPGKNGGNYEPRRRRSIFESRKELPPLSLGRPLKQSDIEDAITEAVIERSRRGRRQAGK